MLEYIKKGTGKQDKCVPCSLVDCSYYWVQNSFFTFFILGVSEVASSKNKPNFHKNLRNNLCKTPSYFLKLILSVTTFFYFFLFLYIWINASIAKKIMTNAAIAYVNIPNKETTSAFSTGAAWTSREDPTINAAKIIPKTSRLIILSILLNNLSCFFNSKLTFPCPEVHISNRWWSC